MYTRALSHSSMGLYKECPQRFKFRYLDGIREEPKSYFSFGQSVHKALEFFYRSQLVPPALRELLDYFKTHWIKDGYKSPAEEMQSYNDGIKILNGFYQKHIGDWKPPLSAEYDFNVTVDGVPVCGKIDRIDKLPSGSLHVIDYKTGKAFAPEKALQDEQLTLYQLACESALGAPVEKLTLYHLPSLTPMDSERHPETLVRKLRKNILDVKASIDQGKYDPKPETWKCNRCDYKKICPAWSSAAPAPASRSMAAVAVRAKPAAPPAAASRAFPADPFLKSSSSGETPYLKMELDELIQKAENLTASLKNLKKNLNET